MANALLHAPAYQAAALALLDAGGALRQSHPAAQLLWFDASHVACVYDAAAWRPDDLVASAADLWSQPGADVVDVVIVGGPEALRDAVRGARTHGATARTLGLTRVSDGGAVEVDHTSRRVAEALRSAFTQGVPALRPEADVEARVAASLRRGRAQADELASFQDQLSSRSARVTTAALAVIAALFAAQWALGDHGIVTDLRMGALAPSLVAREPWRLVSYAFLHANGQHVAFNAMTLYSLGSFYERLLGRWRFAGLFVASAIGGGVAACFAGPTHIMVGASGALWGMLGVSFALALRPGDTLPAALLPGFRRNAALNLALQVAVSMLPHVSWQAHLGGGLAGFALMLSGALRPRADGRGEAAWRVAGGLSVALSLASIAAALAVGQPWTLRGRHSLESILDER